MKKSTSKFQSTPQSIELLKRGLSAWNSLKKLREERSRNIRFKNGDQWSDKVEDPEKRGQYIREEDILRREGKSPLKHNFIQQFIRNISGQMLASPSQSIVYTREEENSKIGEMLTNALQSCHEINLCERLNITAMEEMLLSGVSCVKIRYDFWHNRNKSDGRLNIININRLFFNNDIEDSRLFDIELIGEIHDYTIEQIIQNFASTPKEEKEIRNLYKNNNNILDNSSTFINNKLNNIDYLNSKETNKYRVIEIWEKKARWINYYHDYEKGCEYIEEIDSSKKNNLEKRYEYYWEMTCLTPNGEILTKKESPYTHGEHPYVLTTIPIIDGTIHSLISDIVDIQKYINRLIVMIDFIMGSSAKGVLMVPENCIPEGYSVDDFTNEYVKANGVIVYKPNHTRDVPFQISSNSTNVGAWEMLSLQMNLIQQISGISGAIQGNDSKGYVPASLYAQQASNSQINYRVLFDCLKEHQKQRDQKLLKVLMQYYTPKRFIEIAGKDYDETAFNYEEDKIENITDFNLVVSQSFDTPVYRQLVENSLKKMLDDNQIDIETYLTNSTLPFTKKILTQLKNKQ